MHISDGYLPASTCIGGYALTGLVTWYSLGKIKREKDPTESIPNTDYGTLKAEVVGISPDVIPSDRPGVASFYEATIRPEKSYLASRAFLPTSEARCAIQVGMEGRADIISKKETVLQFMLRKARLNINW